MTGDDDLYRVDGSKVWMSPTAVQYAREYFGDGHQGVRKMAEYLRLRHTMQQAALTSPTAPMSDLGQYLGAPNWSGEEVQATEGDQQQPPMQDDTSVDVLGVSPRDDFLPNVAPLD
jgi:hypothetical protein